MLTKIGSICLAVLFTCCLAQVSMAQEFEFELVHVTKSFAPVFPTGSEGDLRQIQGFLIGDDVLLGGVVIGESSGRVDLLAPPLDLTRPHSFGFTTRTSCFGELGCFEASGYLVGLTNSSTPRTGEVTLALTAAVENGSGVFANIYGVVTAVGTANLYTAQSTMRYAYRVRLGY